MENRKAILAVGLAAVTQAASEQEKQEIGSPEQIRNTVMAEIEKMRGDGIDLEIVMVKPDDTDSALKEIKDKLASKKWSGFMVGFGVRGSLQYTIFFEQLINAAIELAPGTKMGFNTRPHNMHDCVRRNF